MADAEAKDDLQAEIEARAEEQMEEQLIPEDDVETDFRERVISKAKAETEAEARADTEAKARAEAEARADAEAKARAEAEARADAEAKARAEAEAKAETEAKARAEAEAKAEAETKAATEARIATETETKAAAEAAAAAAAAAKLEAEAELKAAAEATALSDAEVKAAEQAKSLADTEAKAAEQAKFEAEAELRAIAKTKASLKAEAKAIAEAKAELEAEAKAIAEAKAKLEAEAKIVAEAKEKLKTEVQTVAGNEVKSGTDSKIKKEAQTEIKTAVADKKEKVEAKPDKNELNIEKAIVEQRGVQTFRPVIATFATDQEHQKELFKVSFQIINTDGSVVTMEEINKKTTSMITKKHIDQWMLRQLLGRVVDEGGNGDYMFLVPFSEAWFSDITLYNWLQKLLSEVSNLKPGNSITIEINATILKHYEKRAIALINTLQQNHGFQIALGGITSVKDIGLLTEFAQFNLLTLNHKYIKELCNTVTSEENEEGEKYTLLQSLKRKDILIIADGIEDSTSFTDAISAGTDYAIGDFIGETQDSLGESANVESFELV